MRSKRMAALTLAAVMMAASLGGCATGGSNEGKVTESGSTKGQAGEQTKDKSVYKRDFSSGGIDGIKTAEGRGTVSLTDGRMDVAAEEDSEIILLDEKAPVFRNGEVEISFDPVNDNVGGMYGIILRYTKDGSWTFFGQDGISGKDPVLTSWVMRTSDGKRELLQTDGQRVYTRREKPYVFKVRLVDNAVTLYLDQVMIYSGEVGGVTQEAGSVGLCYSNGSGAHVQYLTASEITPIKVAESTADTKQIASDALEVTMDAVYPRVMEYKLSATGKVLGGQETPNYAVEINNNSYSPLVTSEFTADKAVYHTDIKELGVSFDVGYQVKGNVLRMELTNIKDDANVIKTINFPGQSMVSMRNDQPGAELRVNNYRTEEVLDLSKTYSSRAYQTTSLAVLSCEDIAASINNGNINNRQEIAYQTTKQADHYTTGLWTNEFQYKGLDDTVLDTMWSEVVITGDRNKDEKVDYQDGAIARRDDIGSVRIGSEDLMNSTSMIAMNVGSIAQYPFLRILDNIKKFNAGTDGFGQTILIKGYQSEGHDASHPDYANISTRAGGKEDFQTLLNQAGAYGAKIGLHINHTEAYPEAKQYSKELVSDAKGWVWYDDSYHIIRENDILNQEDGLDKRLDDLAALTNGKLSMIYVDTYQDSRWQADRLAKAITDHGWMLGTEYSEEMLKYSTWSHTINSTTSKYDSLGNLVRFIDNQNKDIFGNSSLFRGFDNRNKNAGFDGWQECKNYDATIENFFTKVLPQKYLANFPVNQWEEDKVTLGADNQVVTAMVDEINQITKDGNLIADGNKIFIPWSPKDETKIYHWNEEGGSSTWTLPISWKGVTQVKLFMLTDEGRTDEKQLNVKDNQVTIDAAAKTGYVLYKGTNVVENTDMTSYNWGEGTPVKDMGFDSHTFGYGWEKSSTSGTTAHITFENNAKANSDKQDVQDNQMGNTHIHVAGGSDASLTQEMTGLVPGKTYSASVFLEGTEGRKLAISVTTPDGQTVTNYADDFTVPYGVPHNDRFATHYQRVKLAFVMPEGASTATICLNAEKSGDGNAWANFDNVRVTPIESIDNKNHLYYEDFENVDQELGVFVCPTKTTQSHLSETNGDWTKDVIDGRYSLKVRGNGNPKQDFNHMRTVSHRVRLLPNTTYSIGLNYMVTDVAANEDVWKGEKAFTLGVKSDKAVAAGDTAQAVILEVPCLAADSTSQKLENVTFTTGNYTDYYIDLEDSTSAHEFIIDNFYVDSQ